MLYLKRINFAKQNTNSNNEKWQNVTINEMKTYLHRDANAVILKNA